MKILRSVSAAMLAGLLLCAIGASAQDWRITAAEYGAGGRRVDVTQRLIQAVATGNDLRVNNDSMGGDPAPGQHKVLTIHARNRDQKRDFTYRETETVMIAVFGGVSGGDRRGPNDGDRWHDGDRWRRDLRILGARYGSGSRTADVTAWLQRQISGSDLNVRVANETMGGDPSPDRYKTLFVTYQVGNDPPQTMSVGEGEDLRINAGGGGCMGPNCGGGGRGRYHGVLAPEWQQKFDSYYSRWMGYLQANDKDEIDSMERRMRDIMVNYNIPPDTPFREVASPGMGR